MELVDYQAIYEGGVFNAVHSARLPEHTRVFVRASTEPSAADREAAKRRMLNLSPEAMDRANGFGRSPQRALAVRQVFLNRVGLLAVWERLSR